MSSTNTFLNEDLVLVFSYAPAGLGHLRVVSALRHGLPFETNITLLGSHDPSMRFLHRITTTHPIEKAIADWVQTGPMADFFAGIYKKFLKYHSNFLYEQLSTIVEQRVKQPKKVVVVATHFALAHQLVAVKERIEKQKGIKIYLVVQVTDDTFHPMWHVEGSDLTFVPSEFTKQRFKKYENDRKIKELQIVPNSYPVNPNFFKKIEEKEFQDKLEQLDSSATSNINISIPISGAAVGTNFHYQLIKKLSKLNDRVRYFIVARKASFTNKFLNSLAKFSPVNLFSSENEKEIIEYYDNIFHKNLFSIEITKPSEMAFKALVRPNSVAGVVLLFMQPIGKQEEDNLLFLQSHNLIPNEEEQEILWSAAKRKDTLLDEEMKKFTKWRGLRLPAHPKDSAKFISWCFENNLFAEMMKYRVDKIDDRTEVELSEQGVERFWKQVEKLVSN